MGGPEHFLDHARAELVFGMVSAVGTNLDVVRAHVEDRLRSFGYGLVTQRLSQVFQRLQHGVTLTDAPEFARITSYMDAGDEVRKQTKRPDFAALYVINEIGRSRPMAAAPDGPREPKRSQAWLLWSLKRPEEVTTFKRVYREGFFLIGVFSPRADRKAYLVNKGMTEAQAERLIARDEHEEAQPHNPLGQQTSRTFHLADVFVDITSSALKAELDRFIDLVFGHPFTTPTIDEHSMFLAHSASLRSADLSRQVGAVVLSREREVVSIGANDVPAPMGGLYWPGDADERDHEIGHDSNEVEREAMLDEVLDRLGPLIAKAESTPQEARQLLAGCRVLDITEFGRAVHAEMEAILSAGRSGVSTRGGTLYATTFPCHNCAKHIVAAGLQRVLYIEPYPKSRAADLHGDAIDFESKEAGKVQFEPFVGIGPRRFFDLFSTAMSSGRGISRKAKGSRGRKAEWDVGTAEPRLPLSPLSYLEREEAAAELLNQVIAKVGVMQ